LFQRNNQLGEELNSMANPRDQKAGASSQQPGPRCSFCNKAPDHVGLLIESPAFDRLRPAYICGQCVELCSSILDHHKRKPTGADEPKTEYFLDCADLAQ
jgi:hypothetical protein